MQVINFIDSTENVKANLFIDSYGRVEIKFLSEKDIPDESILLSGFIELNEHNYICQSDFKDMRYLYCRGCKFFCVYGGKILPVKFRYVQSFVGF